MGLLSEFRPTFKKLFSNKWIKFAFALNFLYLFIGIIYYVMNHSGFFFGETDFDTFFHAGYLSIYNYEKLYSVDEYIFPFRYLPLTAYLFSLFSFNPELKLLVYFFYMTVNFIINIPIIIIIYQIVFGLFGMDKKYEKFLIRMLAVYLAYVPNVENYINGQPNLFIAFFLLLSLYFFEKIHSKNQNLSEKTIKNGNLLGGLFFGLAILIKITAIFLLPFILIVKVAEREKNENKHQDFGKFFRLRFPFKANFQRLFFPSLILGINAIILIINPVLLHGFLNVNLSGSSEQVLNHSFSLTRIILNLLLEPSTLLTIFIFLSVLIPCFVITLWTYFKHIKTKHMLPIFYSLGLLTLLIGYFDSWVHHLVVLSPFMIISIILIKNSRKDNKLIKQLSEDITQPQKEKKFNKELFASDGIFNVSHKDYRHILYLYLGAGLYFWILLWVFIKINILYGLIIFLLFYKVIKILNNNS
jgi:hypothetical protein